MIKTCHTLSLLNLQFAPLLVTVLNQALRPLNYVTVHSLPSYHLLLGWHFSIALLPTSLPCFLLSESLCWLSRPSEGAYLGVQDPSQINHKFASSLHPSTQSMPTK